MPGVADQPSTRSERVSEPFWWLLAALITAALLLPQSKALFGALFPALDRPVYAQETFVALLLAHARLVALSSAVSIILGMAVGIFVTRPAGREFRMLLQTLVAAGQTVPPVAVLAIAVPLLGFGQAPALFALALYGLLPIVHGTVAGLESVPPSLREAADGLGMSPMQVLARVELPLAAPVIIAGVRTSVIINIGTAALASTVGVKTLGSPIIIGLTGFNTAYVIQGAVLVALLALVADRGFELLGRRYAPPK